jgi:hypothetical protein
MVALPDFLGFPISVVSSAFIGLEGQDVKESVPYFPYVGNYCCHHRICDRFFCFLVALTLL